MSQWRRNLKSGDGAVQKLKKLFGTEPFVVYSPPAIGAQNVLQCRSTVGCTYKYIHFSAALNQLSSFSKRQTGSTIEKVNHLQSTDNGPMFFRHTTDTTKRLQTFYNKGVRRATVTPPRILGLVNLEPLYRMVTSFFVLQKPPIALTLSANEPDWAVGKPQLL